MSNKETGGPAFPVTRDEVAQNDAWGGMTLRDYFAAKADMTPGRVPGSKSAASKPCGFFLATGDSGKTKAT